MGPVVGEPQPPPRWITSVKASTAQACGVIQRGGDLGQIGVELAVLTAYGAVLLAGGSYALRRSIVG